MTRYIIVGAGPAGCVLANRLSQNPGNYVVLLEAGPVDRHPWIHMPKGIGRILANPKYTWVHSAYEHGSDTPSYWLRGKTLGGSSSVNGLIYVRGQHQDYDDLAAQAGAAWRWSEIGRCFAEMEDHQLGAGERRGVGGPLRIGLPNKGNPLSEAVLAAGAEIGLARCEDVNDPEIGDRIGYVPRTIYRGRRQSAATAFLRPILHRKNLTVVTGTEVERVIFDGETAIGVEARVRGRRESYRADRTILCGGTLSSPVLLEQSGIGDPVRLQSLGITIVRESPEVGENLQEHYALIMQWRLRTKLSQNPEFQGWRLARNVVRYYLNRGGPMADATFELGAWLRTRPDLDRPDAQLLVAPYTIDFTAAGMATERHHSMQVGAYLLRPTSTGSVHIEEASAPPRIALDFFATEADRRGMTSLVRAIRRLCEQAPLSGLVAEESRPGAQHNSDEEILAAYRRDGGIAYHAVGTCRMGLDDRSVVDPMTAVRGVKGLNIVDLSILPFIPAGNTYGPVAAIAWRAAELIDPSLRG